MVNLTQDLSKNQTLQEADVNLGLNWSYVLILQSRELRYRRNTCPSIKVAQQVGGRARIVTPISMFFPPAHGPLSTGILGLKTSIKEAEMEASGAKSFHLHNSFPPSFPFLIPFFLITVGSIFPIFLCLLYSEI